MSMYQDIPEEFYSFESNQPFTNCIECNKYLLDGQEYMIEKAMKRYPGYSAVDTVFDYAICMECANDMRKEFSKESIEKIDNYFQTNMKPHVYPSDADLDIDECLGKCMVKEKSISEISEYQIFAFCKGNQISKQIPPYMISSLAIDDLLPLISQSTSDFLNGFYNKHFSPDPSLMEPTPDGKLVFI